MIIRTFLLSAVLAMLLIKPSITKNMNRKQYKTIENYMDPTANPCSDYYQYACGNWEQVHANDSYSDTFEKVDYEINEEYSRILKSRRRSRGRQHRFVQQVLAYYRSCMSVTRFEPAVYLSWLEEHENITWPDIMANKREKNAASEYDWLHMLATLRKYRLNGILLSENLLQKRDDARHMLIDFDRPVMDDEFEPLEQWQFELMLNNMGVKRKWRQLWNVFHNFETKLKKLYELEDEVGFEEVKLVELNIPQLERYIQIVLEVPQLDPEMNITISNRPFIHALFKMLADYDDESICRYIMMRMLWHLNYDGPTDFEKIACISNVRDQMPLAMAWLYEQDNPELLAETQNIENLFERLRAHFANTLTANANKFDTEVLEFLSFKLKGMQLKVGNLPRNATLETMEDFHKDLTLTENDFYANHLKLLRFQAKQQHARLHTVIPQDAHNFYYLEDVGLGATTTPYFLQRSNIVIVPLTLLHLPLYHPQLHDVFKYSLIGFLLAHELTHGFDDSGLDYDQYGNSQSLSEVIKANEIFDEHLDCLQHDNPHVTDEKIADISGLRWAFETYFSNSAVAERPLAWSQLPQEQLFFRNFALFFCGSIANEDKLINSTHGTYRSRLYDTLSHFAEFGRVYQCPEGSPMNPIRKCQLWR